MPRQPDDVKMKRLVKLLKRPRTVDELEKFLEAPRRTIYRWLGSIPGVVRLGTKNRDVHYQIMG